MGFVAIFWKKNIQEAYLPKSSIVGQIVSEILAQLCSDDSIQILLNFLKFDLGLNVMKKWKRISYEEVFLLSWPVFNLSQHVAFSCSFVIHRATIGPSIAGVTDEHLGFQWSTSVSYILTRKSCSSLLYSKPKGECVWFAAQWSRIYRYRYVYTCVVLLL